MKKNIFKKTVSVPDDPFFRMAFGNLDNDTGHSLCRMMDHTAYDYGLGYVARYFPICCDILKESRLRYPEYLLNRSDMLYVPLKRHDKALSEDIQEKIESSGDDLHMVCMQTLLEHWDTYKECLNIYEISGIYNHIFAACTDFHMDSECRKELFRIVKEIINDNRANSRDTAHQGS